MRLTMYRDFTVAFQGVPSSSDQQQPGIAFSPRRLGHSTILLQEIDLEAARDVSDVASREKVDVVRLDKAEFEGEHDKESGGLDHLSTTLQLHTQ